jgi:8-oxo-dGTP pyrophosphatase MutT (NUDIX family)
MPESWPILIPKVSVFVIDDDDRLLVFEHPESPEAGIQVPAGTLEPGEDPETGAFREVCEETGRDAFAITGLVARRQLREMRQGRLERHDRWFYRASPTQPLPEVWMGGDWTSDGWVPFRYSWIGRPTAELVLTPDHVEVFRLTARGNEEPGGANG